MSNTLTPAGWYDFDDLPPRLQQRARLLRPRWARAEFHRFRFRVKDDGELSAKIGEHQPTKAAAEAMESARSEFEPTIHPSKRRLSANARGDFSQFRTTSFGLSKEPL